mmetsp:Transcript_25606/g.64549  ORF Transcript_25606/g.64549 Transcript_25606/m.64549 type:complete len:216 (-) Transcript_25606:122-769(-)
MQSALWAKVDVHQVRIVPRSGPGGSFCAVDLQEMIKEAPSPHFVRPAHPIRLDLNHNVVPHLTIRHQIWLPAGDIPRWHSPPAQGQHVAVWHRLEVVVREVRVRRHLGEPPHHLVLPSNLLDASCISPQPGHVRPVVVAAIPQQVSVGQEVRDRNLTRRPPLVHDAPGFVDEVCFSPCADQSVARLDSIVVPHHHTYRTLVKIGAPLRWRRGRLT